MWPVGSGLLDGTGRRPDFLSFYTYALCCATRLPGDLGPPEVSLGLPARGVGVTVCHCVPKRPEPRGSHSAWADAWTLLSSPPRVRDQASHGEAHSRCGRVRGHHRGGALAGQPEGGLPALLRGHCGGGPLAAVGRPLLQPVRPPRPGSPSPQGRPVQAPIFRSCSPWGVASCARGWLHGPGLDVPLPSTAGRGTGRGSRGLGSRPKGLGLGCGSWDVKSGLSFGEQTGTNWGGNRALSPPPHGQPSGSLMVTQQGGSRGSCAAPPASCAAGRGLSSALSAAPRWSWCGPRWARRRSWAPVAAQ